ncbi:MAG: polyprenyl synthetase family protein [Myxococcota bacterium]
MTQAAWQDSVLSSLSRVGQRQGLDALAERFEDLVRWLGDDFAAFEHTLAGLLTEAQDETSPVQVRSIAEQAARYLLALPGKRIRPLCVMLASKLGDESDPDQVRDVAIACELVHVATLLHDDVIDEGTDRRGVPAARVVYGNSAAILGGDHLLILALQRTRRVGNPRLIDGLLETIAAMVEAEAIQLERRGLFEPSRDAYMAVIRGKTAALFRWGLAAGGILAGLDRSQVEALEHVGVALGMAFQLADDLLDLRGDPAITGKNTLADLREGKMTWPLLVACEKEPALTARLREMVSVPANDGNDPAQLITAVEATGAIEATRAFALEQRDRAQRALDELPPTTARQALVWVTRFAAERAH